MLDQDEQLAHADLKTHTRTRDDVSASPHLILQKIKSMVQAD
jgi:hypothetical protein